MPMNTLGPVSILSLALRVLLPSMTCFITVNWSRCCEGMGALGLPVLSDRARVLEVQKGRGGRLPGGSGIRDELGRWNCRGGTSGGGNYVTGLYRTLGVWSWERGLIWVRVQQLAEGGVLMGARGQEGGYTMDFLSPQLPTTIPPMNQRQSQQVSTPSGIG